MDKKTRTIFITGLLGGVAGSFLFLLLSANKFIIGTDSLRLSGQVLNLTTPIPVLTLAAGLWEKIAADQSLSIVGIQVFLNNRLVKEGSGIIISSDGLVLTTADMAISGAIYQMSYEDQIIKGSIKSVDYNLNLLLLRAPSDFSKVAEFNASQDYKSGQEVLVVGKIIDITKPVLVTKQGIISYVAGNKIVLDLVSNSYLSGAGVINANQRLIGISYLRSNKVQVIGAGTIDGFLRDYFSKTDNK